MDGLQFIASLVGSLAWPLAVLALALVFKRQLGELIGRLRSVKALGAEGTFDPRDAESAVALATATATASVQEAAQANTTPNLARDADLADRLHDMAVSHPRAAVMEAWAEVEEVLRARLGTSQTEVPRGYAGRRLINLALGDDVINRETAEALVRLSTQRNLAAHEGEVTVEKALDYLALCDSVIYALKVGRAFARPAHGTGTAHDATVRTEERKPEG
jgi:hypothetical protein